MYRGKLNIIIIIIVITVSSCRSLRLYETVTESGTVEINAEKLVERVKLNNIIAGPLAINKIIINYEQGGESRRLRANLKYNGSDSILISIRTFAGIEAARVLIEKDTVRISDKINKIYYLGRTEELGKKYGIKFDFIDLFFGDIGNIDKRKGRLRCEEGLVKMQENVPGRTIVYTIDCNINKIKAIEGTIGYEEEKIRGTFDEFRSEDGLLYPGEISWHLNGEETVINIEMQNLKRSGSRNIIFRVGSDYKLRLLK